MLPELVAGSRVNCVAWDCSATWEGDTVLPISRWTSTRNSECSGGLSSLRFYVRIPLLVFRLAVIWICFTSS